MVLGEARIAIRDFDTAIRFAPQLGLGYVYLDKAYGTLEDHDQAIIDFDTASRIDPLDADALNACGVAYARKGRTDLAIKDFNTVVLLRPNFASAYYNRGHAYYIKGDIKGDKDRAVADYVTARRIDPQYPEPPPDLFESYDMDLP